MATDFHYKLFYLLISYRKPGFDDSVTFMEIGIMGYIPLPHFGDHVMSV